MWHEKRMARSADNLACGASRPARAQDWFKTGTGLGVTKARLAAPDLAARSAQAQPLEKTFHDVLWSDLEYSGVLDMVSPSFYPTQVPSQPSEMKAADWAAAPSNAYMVAYGNMTVDGASLAVAGFLSDVHNPTAPLALQKIYRGDAKDTDARKLAHQFADDIIGVLSGGLPGIAQTQIAYVSNKTGNKEIWVMDYDGANPRQLSTLRSISLTPRWSPDATRIAFTCYVPFRGITSAQICIYSTGSNRLISFPRYPRNEQLAGLVARRLGACLHVQPGGRPGNLRLGHQRRPFAPGDIRGGSEHLAGVESENGQANRICKRPRRKPGVVFVEFRWIGRAENRSAGQGLCDRPVMVSQWPVGGLQLAAAERKL